MRGENFIDEILEIALSLSFEGLFSLGDIPFLQLGNSFGRRKGEREAMG